jgi:putative ABC transport system permease protein
MFGQVALAVVFAVTAALLYGQFRHMAEADFGFESEQVLAVETQGASYATLRDGLQEHSGVTAVGGINPLPAMGSYYYWQIPRRDAEPLRVLSHAVTPQTPDVLGLEQLAGRPLTEADVQAAADTSSRTGAVLVTRLLAERLGYDTPKGAVGQRFEDGSTTYVIAGVVEDFRTTQSDQPLEPVVLYPDAERVQYVLARVQPGAEDAVRTHAAAVWEETGSIHALDATLLATRLAERPSTRVMGNLAVLVAGVAGFAVLLACLGLLGMAAYRAETRVREVGIRKALGATATQIVRLLAGDLMRLVALAVVLGTPVAYLGLARWLDTFAYRIDLGPGLFLAAGGLTLALALAVAATHTLRAARTDPASVLRAE